MKVKILRKLAVLCLVLVMGSASWAACCKDSGSCKKGDDQKTCQSKDKKGDCEKKKSGCPKSESKQADNANDKAA